jgi:hypothetical protein
MHRRQSRHGGDDDGHTRTTDDSHAEAPGLARAAPRVGARSDLGSVLHDVSRYARGRDGVAANPGVAARRVREPAMDRQLVQHRDCRGDHLCRGARRSLRAAALLRARSDVVHGRIGRLCSRTDCRVPDRCANGAGTRRGDHPAAQPDDSHRGVSDRAPGHGVRHLRGSRRSCGRARSDRRRCSHPGARLALDLLDQRPDRHRGRPALAAPVAGDVRTAHAPRPRRGSADHGRARRHRLESRPRERCRLVERRDDLDVRGRSGCACRLRRLGGARRRASDALTATPAHPRVRGR